MSRAMPHLARVLLLISSVWWGSLGMSVSLEAASGPNPEDSTPALPGANSGVQTNPPAPALPGTKTAADTFRELLAMNTEQRARVLADRTEHQRKYLEDR